MVVTSNGYLLSYFVLFFVLVSYSSAVPAAAPAPSADSSSAANRGIKCTLPDDFLRVRLLL